MSRKLSENMIRRIVRQALNEEIKWKPSLPALEAAEALYPHVVQFLNTLETNEQLKRVIMYVRYSEDPELSETLTEAENHAKKLKFCLIELGVEDQGFRND